MKPASILVVEDEALIAADLELRLKDMGYHVAGIADTGEEAIHLGIAHRPDLAIMDIRLKGDMDGIDAAEVLSIKHQIPVVFLTSHADPHTLSRTSKAEPLGYIVKPFNEQELHATIQTALNRHQAEERHRRMERWLATTLESIGDGVLATDLQGRVTFLNRVAENLTGWSNRDAAGLPSTEVLQIRAGTTNAPPTDLVREALSKGDVVYAPKDSFLISRKGEVTPIDDSCSPIIDENGRLTGVVLVFRDRTGTKHLEEERRRMEDKIREAQKLESLGVLAGGIAHDFNNLLTGVLGNASLIAEEIPAGSPLQDHVREIEKAAMRAADLCKQMLAYAGKGRFVINRLDLTTLVQDSEKLLQISISKNVVLKFNLASHLPAVAADATQLRQILMNLVINASEAIGERSGVITVSTGVTRADQAYLTGTHLFPDLPEGDYAYLEVADTGCGMDRETLARIYDPFFTTKFLGRGLGLAAVLGIVRGHKGALKVHSEPGRGTAFKLLLPGTPGLAEQFNPVIAAESPWHGKGLVLVIDDEETVRIMTAKMLESFGFATIMARDGVAGLGEFRLRPDQITLVLLDLTMPRLDGVETFRELRRVCPDVKVLLMSGYNELEAVGRFTGKGLAGFIQKPFNRAQLLAKLRLVLENQPG